MPGRRWPCESPRPCDSPPPGGGARIWPAAGPEPSPTGRQLRTGENLSAVPAGQHCWRTQGNFGSCWPGCLAPHCPGPAALAGWPLRVWGPQPLHPPELMLALEHHVQPQFPRCLSLHTSLQAEGAGSGLDQPREGLPQFSGKLKGSSSPSRVDAKAEEVQGVRAANTLSPLNN